MDEKCTTENIPDLTGKVIIVTGGNSGVGFEAVKEFARKGAKTIMASRNLDKAKKALGKIQKIIPKKMKRKGVWRVYKINPLRKKEDKK